MDASLRPINRLHTTINGIDPATGERYDALDPDLLLWVHACLEVSAVYYYERTVCPMTPHQKQVFHEENLLAAEMVLLPRDRVPATYPELEAYVQGVIDSDRLLIHGERLGIRMTFHPPCSIERETAQENLHAIPVQDTLPDRVGFLFHLFQFRDCFSVEAFRLIGRDRIALPEREIGIAACHPDFRIP